MSEQCGPHQAADGLPGRDGYPAYLIDAWHSRDVQFVLRPVLPQDRQALGDFIVRLSPASRYRRFHWALRELPEPTLRAMTEVDYHESMAIVVTARSAAHHEAIVADARYVVDADGSSAQFALVVSDAWQCCGIGSRVTRMLLEAASRARLDRLIGSVLADNRGMLGLARSLDFSRARDPESPGLVTVEKRLSNPAGSRWLRTRSFMKRVSAFD